VGEGESRGERGSSTDHQRSSLFSGKTRLTVVIKTTGAAQVYAWGGERDVSEGDIWNPFGGVEKTHEKNYASGTGAKQRGATTQANGVRIALLHRGTRGRLTSYSGAPRGRRRKKGGKGLRQQIKEKKGPVRRGIHLSSVSLKGKVVRTLAGLV